MEANACKNKKTGGSKRRAKSMKKTRPNKVIKFTEDCYEFVYCDVCKVSFVFIKPALWSRHILLESEMERLFLLKNGSSSFFGQSKDKSYTHCFRKCVTNSAPPPLYRTLWYPVRSLVSVSKFVSL